MNKLSPFLFLVTALLFSLITPINAQESSDQDTEVSMENFLQQATLSGLSTNALSKELIQNLLNEQELWVGKCPICDEVRRGFHRYLNEEDKEAVEKLDNSILNDLESDIPANRKAALKLLIDQYIQQYFVKLEMPEDKRKAMEKELLEARKIGMDRANASSKKGFYCASCDGACHKPAPPKNGN